MVSKAFVGSSRRLTRPRSAGLVRFVAPLRRCSRHLLMRRRMDSAFVGLAYALVVAAPLYAQTTPALTFSASNVHIASEARGTTSYTVVLATQPTGPVSVAVSSGDRTVATVSPSSLTFTMMNWNTAQTVTVTAVDDDVDDEFGRRTTITHTASGGGYNNVSGTVRVTVQDDDQATIQVRDSSLSVREGGTVTQKVWITSEPKGDVTINLTNENSTLVTMDKTSLSFTPSNWETKQDVTFSGVEDTEYNGGARRRATIKLTASGADYDGFTHTMHVDLIDNEAAPSPALSFSASDIHIADEAGGTTSYTVVLAAEPTAKVTVAVSNSDQTVATVSTSSLTFTTMNWNTAQTVTVTAVDDDIANDGGRRTTITHTASGGNYNNVSGTVRVVVANNEQVSIQVFDSSLRCLEGGTTTQPVWITSEPKGNVTITLTNQHPTSVTMDKTSLSFTPSNWKTQRIVTFSGVDDTENNLGVRSATIKFTASGADYEGLTLTMRVGVYDDESIPITITEGGSLTRSLSVLMRVSWPSIVISPTSSDPDVVTVTPAGLTWTPDDSGQSRDVTLMAVENDALGDGSATISFPSNVSPARWIPLQSFSVTVIDNDVVGPPAESPPISSALPVSSAPPSSFEDRFPAFADTAMIADLVAEVRQPIAPQRLPKATGGDPPLTYSLLGNLPDGLMFHAATRQLRGTPTTETDSAETMIYRVRDANFDADTLMFAITVTPPDLKPTFGDANIPALFAEVDQAVVWPLPSATGGDPPLRYSLWDLPDGLMFNAVKRQLVGAAMATDTTVATYAAIDADGDVATLPFPITIISPDLEPTFGDATLADLFAEVDRAIAPRTLPQAIGGNDPLTYSFLNLPDGLVFNAVKRQLGGAATATDTTVATYMATDADGDAATLLCTITIVPSDLEPTFGDATIEPLTATACQAVARPLPAATGGNGPLTYSLRNLPDGLVFNANSRQLKGSPAVLGDEGRMIAYTSIYAATDADGDAATLPFSITVQMGLDAPDWMRAENYLGADRAGGWDGSVLLTWALSRNHALLDAYRIYREVRMTHSADEHGRVVALDQPRAEFVPWARIDAVPGVSMGSALVKTLDYRATRWAVAAECGGQRACLRVAGDPGSGCRVGCPRDAPEWVRAEDYLGADLAGGWRGSVLLTWALPSEHAAVDAYRIYREVWMTHSADEHGRVVALAEPRAEFIPWARIDAVPGVSVGSALVQTLDYRATRWAVAAECGGQRTYLRITSGTNGAARPKAVSSEARPDPQGAQDVAVLLPEAFAFAEQDAALKSQAALVAQSATTATEGRVGSIGKFALGPNYPNPFNPTTTIQYALPQAVAVQLTVHNALGQVVRTLVAEHQSAGHYAVNYDGRDDHGQPLSSGLYFYRLQAGSISRVEKMVLLR